MPERYPESIYQSRYRNGKTQPRDLGKREKDHSYHEAGHAILFHVLEKMDPVYTISIIPTGAGAAGYTMPLPNRDEMFNTRGKMLEILKYAWDGRIAEELIFDDITTGASEDIRRATGIAKAW